MSIHEILVVKINSVFPHPYADNLELITIEGFDYSIISKKGEFKPNDLGIYIEPDYIVPTDRSEFLFLSDNERKTKVRITNRKLRGIWSDGLLIPAKSEHILGQNVIQEYGIERWEPPIKNSRGWGNEGSDLKSGWCAPGPNIVAPKYDLENYRKHSHLITEDDIVYYTVKIHGCGGRYVFNNNQMHCGSRTTWKYKPGTVIERINTKTKESIQTIAPNNSWWQALEQNPWIEEWCRKNPDVVVYGEVFGNDIQGDKFQYGYSKGQLGFRVFDVLENNQWINFHELATNSRFNGLELVPVIYYNTFNKETLYDLIEADENSFNCGKGHIREGVVIKLKEERYDSKIGRIALKCVSRRYLQKS